MKINRKRLEIEMANACLTPKELADVAKMPRPTLNGAITGRSIRPATAGKIARALNVPVTKIIEE